MNALVLLALVLTQPSAPSIEPPIDWKSGEKNILADHVQLTTPQMFLKAGESYFDHQSPPQWIIFQAIPRPAGDAPPDPNYSMYVAKLLRDKHQLISGIDQPILISAPGSSNTCGWFHPVDPGRVIFGSTITPPVATDTPGYSRDKQRYSWQFPPEMEVVTTSIAAIATANTPADKLKLHAQEMAKRLGDKSSLLAAPPIPLFSRPGYDAECSYSSDGRFILYTHVDPTNNDPNLWIFDTKTSKHTPLVTTRGYDGGPFFSPDNKLICYRSDRKGNNVLQLFVAELAFGDDGDGSIPIGIAREVQLTAETPGKPDAEQSVSWCPYFHPSGNLLVYATSEVGHGNYEVFALEVNLDKPSPALAKHRITTASGFDGLPAFSADGQTMMWTSQRGPKLPAEQRRSSQIWIANWKATDLFPASAPPVAPDVPAPAPATR